MQKFSVFPILLLLVMASSTVFGQSKKTEPKTGKIILSGNDSMVFRTLEQIDVYPQKGGDISFKSYSRMVAKIRKVYPFAKEAASELAKYNDKFENAKSDREKRKYVRMVEKGLFSKYEDQIKHLTISEGRYLMLLIDRETGNTSYSIIKEVKGGVSALFWQGVAKVFKNDLKEDYDPICNHYMIEQIVLMIEEEEKAKQK